MTQHPVDRERATAADAPALEARGLGLRARGEWILRDCDFRVPRGRIAALVGPNGDGKSTLLAVAAGLRSPAEGGIRVLGHAPGSRDVLPRVGVLLQDRPLHPQFTVAETLRAGRELNPGWCEDAAQAVVAEADVPLDAKVGRLSGGQRSCVALALALGKRPDLLLLDEPMADLDPLRRHTMTAALMTAAAEHGTTVVMSSHVLAELDLVCDYVLLLAHGRMLVADDVEFVQAAHTLVTHTLTQRPGPPPRSPGSPPGPYGLPPHLRGHTVVEARATGRQLTAIIQLPTSLDGLGGAQPPTLEEILLAYLRNPDAPALLAPADAPAADPVRDPARTPAPDPAGDPRVREPDGDSAPEPTDEPACELADDPAGRPARVRPRRTPGRLPSPRPPQLLKPLRSLKPPRLAGPFWLAWRRHRAVHLTAVALALLAGLWAVWVHHQMVSDMHHYAVACHRASAACGIGDRTNPNPPGSIHLIFDRAPSVLNLLPLAVGALLGAPLFAQDLENGTHRLAWTQSTGRRQWAAAKLAVAAAVTTAAAVLLTVPVTWWWWSVLRGHRRAGPDGDAWRAMVPWLDWRLFPTTGVVGVAHLLLALATGAVVGVFVRRTLPAVAIAAAVSEGWQYGLLRLRPHLLPAHTTRVTGFEHPVTPLDGWWLGDGFVHADGRLSDTYPCAYDAANAAALDYDTCLRSHGVVGLYSRGFHAGQILPLQLIEAGICLVAAGALAALCLARVRRITA